MPIVRENKYLTPYVVYNAPVNEKTKEIREMFDVDPATGYPRHYNWRNMAKLGPEYRPEDAFQKLLPYREEAMYTTYLVSAAGAVILSYVFQRSWNFYKGRSAFSRPWIFLGCLTLFGSVNAFLDYTTPIRQGVENAVYIDYLKSHPDRFETQKRYKQREVLYTNSLVRI